MKLRIFDLDQTLIRTPANTPANIKLYEKATGQPWIISKEDARHLSKKHGRPIYPRRGWWGRAETLQPPLVPDPVPDSFWIKETVDALLKSLEDDSVNLIMSGRHVGLKQEVLRILHQGDKLQGFVTVSKNGHYDWIHNDKLHFYLLGMDGPFPDISPKPQETLPWKIWIINQYRLVYENIEIIEFWEDRPEHVEKFMALNNEFPEDVVVYHVRA